MLIPDERNRRLGSTFNQSVAAFVVSEIADVLEGVPEERVENYLKAILTIDTDENKEARNDLVEALQVLYWEGPSFYTIQFEDGPVVAMQNYTDEEIKKAKSKVEVRIRWLGKLPVDPKTDFPSFTVYENGQEIGGG